MRQMFEAVMVKLEKDAKLPEYKSDGASGADLFSAVDDILQPGEYKMISTGVSISLPVGLEAQIRPRSGLAVKHGVTILNPPGSIDCDYRGILNAIMINHGKLPFEIKKGDRIAQLVIAPVYKANFYITDKLDNTVRGDGGFGSTGR